MVDAKYVDMKKINVGVRDDEKFIDLSEIDIGFSMAEFQKILDERNQTLRALWIAMAEKNRLWAAIVDQNPADKVVCFFKKKKRTAMEWYTMFRDNERKCREYAERFK